jgi:hypothetical protein
MLVLDPTGDDPVAWVRPTALLIPTSRALAR